MTAKKSVPKYEKGTLYPLDLKDLKPDPGIRGFLHQRDLIGFRFMENGLDPAPIGTD